MEQDFLKYGDLVTLFGSIPSSIQSPVRRSRRNPFQAFTSTGFLSAIGFTDDRVFLQTVPNPLADPLEAVGDLINQRDLVFQVWPKLSCEAHKQMRKLKKERDLLNGDSDDEEKEATEEAFIKLSNRIKEEKKANQKILEYALNNPVVYGSEVQFMHVSSKSYLKADISCSESDKSAYKFELSDEYSSKMVFRISPKYNVRQEGEPVQFGDQVLIYSSKLDCYVNFSMSNPIDMDREIPPIDDVPPITRPFDYRKLDEGSQRYEAHISQFRDCLWKIYHYSSYKSEEESMIVRGGDLVRIRHTEHEAYLAADYCMQTENPEVYGRLYYGEFSEESESINSIWEVEIDNRGNKGGNCEILGPQKNYKHLRLRHLLTGRILETGPMEVGHEVWRIPMLVKSQFMRNNYSIIFHGFANNPKKELYYNTAYSMGFRIENDEGSPKTVAESDDEPEEFHRYVTVHAHKDFSTLDTTSCSPKSSLSASPKHLGIDHVKMFRPLRESEFSTKKKLFIVEALEPSAEHAFLLQKVDFEKETDIAFVASSITHLIHFRDLIMSKPEFDQINWDEVRKTLSVLKKLIFFVNNVNSKTQENYDPATYEGMVVQSRQKLLKDFRLIEILTEILYYPFQLNMFTLNNIHNQTFKTIFQYCYRLIKHIIKEYRPNEIYASQWLEFFMGQAMGSDEANDIKAEATLTELIDNNKKILDAKIDKDIISKFVYMLKDNKKEKFVHLLQALIVCDGNAVLKNQTEASTLIFEDEEISKTLIVPFRIQGDEVEIYVEDYSPEEEDCWMPAIEFYHQSQENDDGDNFCYLESLIHLFSNLCLERNYIAIDHLESVYTYDLCFKVVASTREELIGLRSAFLRLMNTLWLDRKPYQPMNLPRYVILMEELYPRALDQIMSSDNKTKRFDGLKGYLQRYFAELAEVGCTKIYETRKNSFTSLALEVTLTLARFGFYNTLKELENLVRPLLVLLNGMRDATNALEFKEFQRELKKFRTEVDARSKGRVKTLYNQIKTADLLDIGIEKKMIERHKESEETLIVMECKEKICHLLKIIMQISEDMCVRRFLHEYKKRVDPPKQPSAFTLSPSVSTERNPSSRQPLNSSPLRGPAQKYSQIDPNSDGTDREGEEVIIDQAQLIAKIAEENQLDFAKLAPTNFSKILFDLIHYEHEDLIHQVFELLYMSHSKQLRLKNVIEHVRVIENFERREAIIAIEEKVKKLIELAETSENWYSIRRPRGSKNEYEQCIQLIKELEYYLMYDDSNVKGRHDSEEVQLDVLGLEEAMEMMSKDSESQLDLGSTNAISSEFQQILRHLKVHEPLLSLLKFEISTPPEIRNETKTRLLSEIMRFLARFIYRERVNQDLLTGETKLLFKMMKKHPDIGVEDVLECLFRDNKRLIQQVDDVDQFARRMIKLFNAGKDFKNSRLLQALIVLMSYKGKPLKLNQVAITSLLTSRENSEKFFAFMMKENKEEFLNSLKKYDDEVQRGSTTGVLIELPYEIDYATSLIHVMASASEGKCAITESKTQAIFPIVDLIAMYENAKRCWHFKYALLLLFTHAYMDTERERKDTANHLGKFLDLMIADMEYILESEDNYEIMYHKGRIKSNIIQEFVFYRGFLPCIDELLTKRIHKSIPSLNDKLVKVLQIVIATRGNTINLVYLKKMRSCIERFKVYAKTIYYKAMNKPYKQADTPLNLSMEVMEDDDVFKEKFTIAVREPNQNAHALKKFVSRLNQREEFQKNVSAEFERLVNSLVNVDRFQETNFYSAPISFEEVTKSLINLVDIKRNILNKDQMLVGLKIFRRVIERENKLHPNTPAAQWTTAMWINSERKIVRRQNDLCRLGLVELLCNMISHCDDVELQFESMLLGIALLLGGNKAVQDEFLKYIQEDIQNNFLISIKETILNSFEVIKKTMSERNKYYWKKTYVITDREKLNRNLAPRKGAKSMDTLDEKHLDEIISSNAQENDEAFYEEIGLSLTLLERVYRFLQLLCEGHNFELQSQLRVQKTFTGSINRRTFDFISHTAYYFNALTKQINIDSLDVGIQILDFLIEAVQGPCEDNQRALAKSNIINSSMDFLTIFKKRSDYMKRGFFTQEQMNKMDQATAKSMKLLNAMIEGSSSSNADILEGMGSLDFSFLIQKLASYYSHLVREKLDMNPETASPQEVTTRLPKDAFDQKVLESFDVYILLSTLADHSQRVTFLLENADEYTDMEQRALEFFRLNTVHIEITFKEKLLKVYFPIYPACRQLSKNTRSEFLQEVNRESPNEKIMGLLQAAPVLFDEMEHLAYLGSKPFKFTMKRYNALRDLSNIISLVINIIIVSTEYLTIRHDQSVPEINDIGKLSSQTVINILGWIQICTSALMIIFWLRVNSPMIFREKWREEVKWKSLTPEQELKLAYMLEDRDLSELPPSVGLEILWKKGPYNPYFFLTGKRDFGHLLVHASYYYKNVIFICRNGKFLFMMFYLVVSILGTALSEITYSLHLLDVINRFKTLRNVVRSVTGNIKQLVLTALLGLILIYIYAIIGYNFFDSQYYSPDIGDAGERFCNTMLQCYLSTLNLGLRSGGGIGDMLMLPSFQPDVRMNYYFRVVFDLTFFLLINIIFLNIIFGIIVDTFAEMRDQKKAMDEDVQNKCYICNLDRNIFDKSGPGFEKHIKNDHFLWNYLFFIYSIKAKDPTEFTGIESYVQQKLKEEDISWFPMFKALEINGGATQDVE